MVSCWAAAAEAATTVCYANAAGRTLLPPAVPDGYTCRPDGGVRLPKVGYHDERYSRSAAAVTTITTTHLNEPMLVVILFRLAVACRRRRLPFGHHVLLGRSGRTTVLRRPENPQCRISSTPLAFYTI